MRPRLAIAIDAPADLAWEQLIDLRWWPRWGPTVRAARLDDGSYLLSAGATGAVEPLVGPWLSFRVDAWQVDADRRCWSWRVAGVPATEHVVVDLGPSQCRVEMTVPWWAASYLGVIAVALSRIRRYAEEAAGTGRPLTL